VVKYKSFNHKGSQSTTQRYTKAISWYILLFLHPWPQEKLFSFGGNGKGGALIKEEND
jgi:hypothetical protein